MKLQKLFFGMLVFFAVNTVLLSCTDTANSDYDEQIELYAIDKAKVEEPGGDGAEEDPEGE